MKRSEFCIGDTNMLVFWSHANPLICVLPDAQPKICVLPDAKPKHKPVEYRLHWVPTQNSGVYHVHFMFFVLISFALGSQREPSFQWNMGLYLSNGGRCSHLMILLGLLTCRYTLRMNSRKYHLFVECVQQVIKGH